MNTVETPTLAEIVARNLARRAEAHARFIAKSEARAAELRRRMEAANHPPAKASSTPTPYVSPAKKRLNDVATRFKARVPAWAIDVRFRAGKDGRGGRTFWEFVAAPSEEVTTV